jgi:putative transposase
MHCLWTLPQDDANFSARWRAIKTAFAKSSPIGEPRSPVITSRGESGIWQRRYWEHTIRNDRDFAAHSDYAHFQPSQAQSRRAPGGLAAVVVSSLR